MTFFKIRLVLFALSFISMLLFWYYPPYKEAIGYYAGIPAIILMAVLGGHYLGSMMIIGGIFALMSWFAGYSNPTLGIVLIIVGVILRKMQFHFLLPREDRVGLACPYCSGKGRNYDSIGGWERCRECDGTGRDSLS